VVVGKRHYRNDEPKVWSAGKTLQEMIAKKWGACFEYEGQRKDFIITKKWRRKKRWSGDWKSSLMHPSYHAHDERVEMKSGYDAIAKRWWEALVVVEDLQWWRKKNCGGGWKTPLGNDEPKLWSAGKTLQKW
jgi:hypothetical protein